MIKLGVMDMAIYEFDCRKCTNEYIGFQNGEWCSWCKSVVDGLKPFEWEWHDENTKLDTCRCKYFTTNVRQEEIMLF